MYTQDRVREEAARQEGFRRGSQQGKAAAEQKAAIKAAKGKGANLAPGATGGKTNINKARRDYIDGKTNVYPG
ncbi:MAG: hypothetical protein IH822_03095 [Chloroflexi bacterium]|nr:hypothetical protein [Chloroflexota bacterium]